MANIISILRIFIVFFAVGLLTYRQSTSAYLISFVLTVLAFLMDGLDGYVARKLNETSKLGAVLDIMGDRIAEYAYWIMFAYLGYIPIIFPLIVVTRGVVTDSLRSVALEQGLIPFGKGSMLDDKVAQWICGGKPIKIGYAVAKAMAFSLLILAYTPSFPKISAFPIMLIGAVMAEISILLCILRAIPVILESRKFFKK